MNRICPEAKSLLCGGCPSPASSPKSHHVTLLESTAVVAFNCGVALAVVDGLLGVRAQEPAVHRSVVVLEADGQSLGNSAVLHPGSQGVETGHGLAAFATVTVANARSLEHAVVRVDIRDIGSDGVIVAQCAVEGDDGVGLKRLLASCLITEQFLHSL